MTALGGVCCLAPCALAKVVAAKHKGPEIDSLGAFMCVCVEAGYSAAGTAKAALAAFAALFFARLTLAQRLC